MDSAEHLNLTLTLSLTKSWKEKECMQKCYKQGVSEDKSYPFLFSKHNHDKRGVSIQGVGGSLIVSFPGNSIIAHWYFPVIFQRKIQLTT